jgi:hypothetical protein
MFYQPPPLLKLPQPVALEQPFQISPNLPFVTLQVSPDKITEDGNSRMIFVFKRSGDLSKPLVVYYEMKGSAEPQMDYKVPSNTKKIFFPSGVSVVSLEVVPIEDSQLETDETVTISLVPYETYNRETLDDVSGVIVGEESAFAIANYANAVPIAVFAVPLALFPWDSSSGSSEDEAKTSDVVSATETKEIPPYITEFYEVPGPLPVLGILSAYRVSRKIRSKIKKSTL